MFSAYNIFKEYIQRKSDLNSFKFLENKNTNANNPSVLLNLMGETRSFRIPGLQDKKLFHIELELRLAQFISENKNNIEEFSLAKFEPNKYDFSKLPLTNREAELKAIYMVFKNEVTESAAKEIKQLKKYSAVPDERTNDFLKINNTFYNKAEFLSKENISFLLEVDLHKLNDMMINSDLKKVATQNKI